ncbi:MAG: imidazole glycerol phosphate synthase subunit HisF [Phycisphaerales bacterium JB065]
MLKSRVIPCLDVRAGRVVKGIRFQNLRDAGCPVEQALAYEAQGADELVMLDVSATPESRGTAKQTVESVRAVLSIPLCVGGGVRSIENAGALLAAGADKVGVNSAAVARPELVGEIADRFGAQCTVVAIDAARRESAGRSGWQVVIRSGTQRMEFDALEWASECEKRGAGEILLTSWDRDGTGEGYDLDLVGVVSQRVSIPVIASGGASDAYDLVRGVQAGADAVLAASIFHDARFTVSDVKLVMRNSGLEVRL